MSGFYQLKLIFVYFLPLLSIVVEESVKWNQLVRR